MRLGAMASRSGRRNHTRNNIQHMVRASRELGGRMDRTDMALKLGWAEKRLLMIIHDKAVVSQSRMVLRLAAKCAKNIKAF